MLEDPSGLYVVMESMTSAEDNIVPSGILRRKYDWHQMGVVDPGANAKNVKKSKKVMGKVR